MKSLKDMMIEMYKLQDKLNTETNGAEWTSGITKESREINWFRCIYMEAMEAMDSLPFILKKWTLLNSLFYLLLYFISCPFKSKNYCHINKKVSILSARNIHIVFC